MVITLTGPNSFMLQQELRRTVDGFIREHGNMGLERLDGEEAEYDRIREALESLPFLAAKKLVVIRSGSANKQFAEQAERLLEGLPETTDVLLVEPKLDKRGGYYKLLKKKTEFREFPDLDGTGLSRWLVKEAKEKGGEISSADAHVLIGRVGANQQLLAGELEKLILYRPKITKESIELMTEQTPQSTTFDLLDAALGGRTEQAIKLYEEQRRQKVEPVQIIALLAWQLHVLAVIKAAGSRDAQSIAAEAKLNPYVVRKSMALAKKLSMNDMKHLIKATRKVDVRSKTESIDTDEAMLHLLMQMGR